jgi:dihydroorotase
MPEHDLAIVGGTVVTPRGRSRLNVHVRDGCVAAISPERLGARETIDATDLLVLPGMVDTHVHLMDPGALDREDFPTGTAAAAAGGVTTIVEHTHALPVRSPQDLREKREHLAGRANVDYGLAAHVWPDRIDGLADLWRAGVTFFKLFTCTTHGVPGIDAGHMQQAFEATATFGGPCLVHCEDESLTHEAEQVLRAAGRSDPAVISEWRSREAEVVAASVTCFLAERAGARVTIAHVSHPEVVEVVARHRAAGATLWTEACPQYFLLREQELLEHGPFRKFTPPARARTDGDEERMWELLRAGLLSYLSSDHAPATRAQKLDGDIWDVHFGLPGLDTTLTMLLDAALRDKLALEDVVHRYAEVPARLYGLHPRKGALAVGSDADVVLVDPAARRTLSDEDVISKAGWSPYAGREVRGRIVATLLRGETVAQDGTPAGALSGRYVPGPGASDHHDTKAGQA